MLLTEKKWRPWSEVNVWLDAIGVSWLQLPKPRLGQHVCQVETVSAELVLLIWSRPAAEMPEYFMFVDHPLKDRRE